MYHEYWGLKRTPLVVSREGHGVTAAPAQQEPLFRLNYLMDNRRRVGLLTGDGGVGKTTVLGRFARETRRRGLPVAHISLTGIDVPELLVRLGDGLGFRIKPGTDLAFAWRQLDDFLTTSGYQQNSTALLFDDADRATVPVIAAVQRITQVQPGRVSGITTVLSVQPESYASVGRQLLELTDLRIRMRPWLSVEVVDYIRNGMAAAGAENPIFDIRAIEAIQEITGGNPLRIRQLVELALVAGAGAKMERIDSATIEAVDTELLTHRAIAA